MEFKNYIIGNRIGHKRLHPIQKASGIKFFPNRLDTSSKLWMSRQGMLNESGVCGINSCHDDFGYNIKNDGMDCDCKFNIVQDQKLLEANAA